MPDLNSFRGDSVATAGLRIDSYAAAASAITPPRERPAAIPAVAFRGAPRRFLVEVTSDLRFAPDLATWSSSSSATSEELAAPKAAPGSERFHRELLAKFEAEPVEDGFVHAGEAIIEKTFQRHGAEAQRWIETFLDRQDSSSAAAAIRCLGRIGSPGSMEWRIRLLDRALAHSSAGVRDAAVQAAELWGDPQAIETLRKHDHREPWLRDYVERVIRDLSE
jgi:hypothetical protein